MRTLDQIMDEAAEESLFSNGASYEIWADRWCDRCKVDASFQRGETMDGCPILAVGLLGLTPAEWTRQGVQDYVCSEFAVVSP
jgi:hypothetical protein